MEIATDLHAKPLMSNLSRGLWGYTGTTRDGLAVTVQSTGIGAPSAAVVVEELAGLGVERAVRIGTCVALDPHLQAGTVVVAGSALAGDGVSRALLDGRPAAGAAGLTERVARACAAKPAIVATADLRSDPRGTDRWLREGAVALDLTTAAVFAVGARAGIEVAAVLVVAETPSGHAPDEVVDGASLGAARGAVRALGPVSRAR